MRRCAWSCRRSNYPTTTASEPLGVTSGIPYPGPGMPFPLSLSGGSVGSTAPCGPVLFATGCLQKEGSNPFSRINFIAAPVIARGRTYGREAHTDEQRSVQALAAGSNPVPSSNGDFAINAPRSHHLSGSRERPPRPGIRLDG